MPSTRARNAALVRSLNTKQAALFRKRVSGTDGDGYVYILSYKGQYRSCLCADSDSHLALDKLDGFWRVKAGRTNNPWRRVKEWRKKCPGEGIRLEKAYRVRYMKRAERLIHLRLGKECAERAGNHACIPKRFPCIACMSKASG